MESKIKLVLILQFEFTQHLADFFCVDALAEAFDLEYWDCSDVAYLGSHYKNKLEKEYVHKIKSLRELRKNLNRLPQDTIISLDVHFVPQNYRFHKILSSHFNKINFIDFYTNFPDRSEPVKPTQTLTNVATSLKPNRFKKFKDWVYRSDFMRMAVQCLKYPNQRKTLFMDYYFKKERALYKIYIISAAVGEKYHINHPDVDKYYRQNTMNEGGYIVYIDQNFPYHPEIRAYSSALDIDEIAHRHFDVLNAYFDKIEKKYGMPIVIAAHPTNENNCYGHRKVEHYNTSELVANSNAVLMHSSNSLSYVMVYDKPVLMLIDDAIRKVPYFCNPIINTSASYGIKMVDMDRVEDGDFEFTKIPCDKRGQYISKYFGNIDRKGFIPNSKLIVQHLHSIYNDMYGTKE